MHIYSYGDPLTRIIGGRAVRVVLSIRLMPRVMTMPRPVSGLFTNEGTIKLEVQTDPTPCAFGNGFAVVADEVRKTAQRAARETTAPIEDSVDRARDGTHADRQVAETPGATWAG
jgi:hypothetical protein